MNKPRVDFGEKIVLKVATTPEPAAAPPQVGDPDELVAFSTFIPRDLYLQLLERKYWEAGFNMQEAVAVAIRTHLAGLETPRQPLPPAQLAKLLQTNKKLKS